MNQILEKEKLQIHFQMWQINKIILNFEWYSLLQSKAVMLTSSMYKNDRFPPPSLVTRFLHSVFLDAGMKRLRLTMFDYMFDQLLLQINNNF